MLPSPDPEELSIHIESSDLGLWCPYCNASAAVAVHGFAYLPNVFVKVSDIYMVACNDCGEDLTALNPEVKP